MNMKQKQQGRATCATQVYRQLYDFFQPEKFNDMAANGLLLDNAESLETVYTATFTSKEVIAGLRKADAKNALLFTHHPGPQRRTDSSVLAQEDYDFLKERNISHFNFHLPLDHRNPYSPSVSLAREIDAVPYGNFFEEGGAVMGLFCTGSWKNSEQVKSAVEAAVGHSCRLYSYGNTELLDGKLAISAGGAEGTEIYEELEKEGIRLFLTGVGTADWFKPSHEAARMHGISILSAGHYSTEKFALISMCRFFRERGLLSEYIGEAPDLSDL